MGNRPCVLGGVALIVLARAATKGRRLLFVGMHCVLPAKVAPPEDVGARADLGGRHWAMVAEATRANVASRQLRQSPPGDIRGAEVREIPRLLAVQTAVRAESLAQGPRCRPSPSAWTIRHGAETPRIEQAASVRLRLAGVPGGWRRTAYGRTSPPSRTSAAPSSRLALISSSPRGRITTGRSPARNPPRTT